MAQEDRKRTAHRDPPADPGAPAEDRLPKRKRGGQELPDDVQDRPEQNAGYDAAVRGSDSPVQDADLLDVAGPDDLDSTTSSPLDEIDDRAERDAAAEVRRRERSSR